MNQNRTASELSEIEGFVIVFVKPNKRCQNDFNGYLKIEVGLV